MKHEILAPGIEIYQGDCRDIMPTFEDKQFDAVITDPPYGINKEDWDKSFPVESIDNMFLVAHLVVIIAGIWTLGEVILSMGDKYIWTVAGHKPAAMTNGRVGLNKWLPAVYGGELIKRLGADAFDFHPVDAGLVGHSCQKPLRFMRWIITRSTNEGDIILDPFMGSGTVGIAAIKNSKSFIGIEIDPEYYETSKKRIKEALMQPRLL